MHFLPPIFCGSLDSSSISGYRRTRISALPVEDQQAVRRPTGEEAGAEAEQERPGSR